MIDHKNVRKNPIYLAVASFLLFVLLVSLACTSTTIDIGQPQTDQQPQTNPPRAQQPTVSAITQQAVPTLTAVPPAAGLPGPGSAQVTPVLLPDLVQLNEQLSPGVVSIRVLVSQQGMQGEAAGSGFLIDTDGHILTNNHVVESAEEVIVSFFNGIESTAEVVGTDDDSDLAVIRARDLPPEVHPLPLGDSDLVKVGAWVIAIGNPFGVGTSMSLGIVSAKGRLIESGATQYSIPEAIQTDAAINPGNSGGPLITLSGEVIGINAQIATSGTNAGSGVGFAIPSNIARRVAPVLIQQGFYQWAYLGVTGESVGLRLQQAERLETQQGAYIDSVVSGGPAEQAGLRAGDVVVAADDHPVRDFASLLAYIATRNPRDQVTLSVLRGGRQIQVPVTLGVRPEGIIQNP